MEWVDEMFIEEASTEEEVAVKQVHRLKSVNLLEDVRPTDFTVKYSSYLTTLATVGLAGLVQYCIAKYAEVLSKLNTLEEVGQDPNARVVTSEQAVKIVNSIKANPSAATAVSAKKESVYKYTPPQMIVDNFAMVKDVNNMA